MEKAATAASVPTLDRPSSSRRQKPQDSSKAAMFRDPEGARDFTKPRMPAATFGHGSAREAIVKELERRKAQRDKMQHATSAAATEPSVPPPQPSLPFSSPDRLRNHQRLQGEVSNEEAALGRAARHQWSIHPRDGDADHHARQSLAGRSVSPSWALIERRVTSPSFRGYLGRSVSVGSAVRRRYTRDPGPGSYDTEDAHAALSYVARAPSAVIPLAEGPRGSGSMDLGAAGAWLPTASSLAAWREADPAAARDRLRPRAPGAVVGTEPRGIQRTSEPAVDPDGDAAAIHAEIVYSAVEPRVRGVIVMRPPPAIAPIAEGEEDAAAGLGDPWSLDSLVRPLKPAWTFGSTSRWPLMDPGYEERARQPALDPSFVLVRPRLQGIPQFAAYLNLRSVMTDEACSLPMFCALHPLTIMCCDTGSHPRPRGAAAVPGPTPLSEPTTWTGLGTSSRSTCRPSS